ncbi:tRNA preQ1(34) S-adenosylmethionine ribosyltransferase-isomerase QueA [Oceanivirga miroungae]|uniref:S-adenosylmethionine:tRNA ribosyltransferase-isomerase n=1 Tax=Oceanivirga miroungae TaxID=1130046 RepID=A0A6I8MC93_9FUSO|nr:tRNA preQ1(34) S-adenosylmethionine ribosyltransferase-isomerase QueA [Oceanivirga miroungae]VWL84786.1 S-adenosylmethionine-tRNA ribosyltransferase-isomerase [Oceanivirga miroungae]
MNINEFDFDLPERLIAQSAIEPRDHSKLLAVNKTNSNISHKKFYDILDYLNESDILVLNRTKVIPARLFGHKKNGVVIECLLLKRLSLNTWEVLLKPAKRLKIGDELIFLEDKLKLRLLEIKEDGNRIVEFIYDGVFEEILDELGELPLPPYIHEKLEDKNRYQTVYAKSGESVAAPTAGLHFTNELLEKIKAKGVTIVDVYLTVGLGTFRPVKVDDIKDHIMHKEEYFIPDETARIINKAKKEGRRIVAVGTTSVRTLESSVDENGNLLAKKDETAIFIYGDYKFKIVDALITNFHLPKSTLVMLVSSFMGSTKKALDSYKIAIDNDYRFFSLGDSMYIGDNV